MVPDCVTGLLQHSLPMGRLDAHLNCHDIVLHLLSIAKAILVRKRQLVVRFHPEVREALEDRDRSSTLGSLR